MHSKVHNFGQVFRIISICLHCFYFFFKNIPIFTINILENINNHRVLWDKARFKILRARLYFKCRKFMYTMLSCSQEINK